MTSLAQASPISFILTSDRAAAMSFYTGVLGLPIVSEDGFAVTFALANGMLLRLSDLPGHRAMDHTVLGWTVPDMTAAVVDLRTRGVTFKIYEGFGQDADGIWSPPGGGAKVAWFADPDGNVLSLTQFG